MKKKYNLLFTFFCLLTITAFGQSEKKIIDTYLQNNLNKLSLTPEDISNWEITNTHTSKQSGVQYVYIQQAFKGIPIYNAVSNFSLKNNEVVFYGNSFVSNIREKTNTVTPSIDSKTAILKASNQLHLGVTNIRLIEKINARNFVYDNSRISQEKIPVSLVFQKTQDGNLRLAWQLNIFQLDGKHWWNIRVDAVSGNIISKNDWGVHCKFEELGENIFRIKNLNKENDNLKNIQSSTVAVGEQYNVFALPVESPNHGSRSLIVDPHNLTASPFGWHDTNGVVGAEYTITRGNNVYAQLDNDNNNATLGYAPNGGGALNFDFPLNLNQPTFDYPDPSVTNLFYMNNVMHDIWYQYGFDEASGNFQENNYGNGGVGSDYVIADGQDAGGRNNANFFTPNEGTNPRMQMYAWDESNLVYINSGSLIGQYTANDSNFDDGDPLFPTPTGAPLYNNPVTANLVVVDDGSAAPTEACVNNVSFIFGKIAVIRRGNCNFTDKIQNAQNAGASGVIMVNNVSSPEVVMAGTTTTITIPAVSVSQTFGESLITALQNGETIEATLRNYGYDGSFDNGIVSHEYGHGISTKLVGGAGNVNCLTNNEQLGEGWSDFFTLMITIENGDLGSDSRGIGTYAIEEPVTGTGIRTYPYSTDISLNPFTFASSNTEVAPHGLGSVWATMLWDLNWRMIAAYGFDSDIYNGTGGNNKTMQLVLEGLKNTPCNSGFIAARDAIIAADDVLYAGVNKCLIWQVFAERGLGFSASSGSVDSNTDQVEAFDMPPAGQLAGADCTLSVSEGNLSQFKIYPNPSNGNISIKPLQNLGDVKATIFDINGRKVFSKKLQLDNEIQMDASSLNAGIYILKIQGDNFSHSEKLIIQ